MIITAILTLIRICVPLFASAARYFKEWGYIVRSSFVFPRCYGKFVVGAPKLLGMREAILFFYRFQISFSTSAVYRLYASRKHERRTQR